MTKKQFQTKNQIIDVYFSLNDFICDYKTFCNNNDIQFDEIFHDFICWFLYCLKIGKNESCVIHKYDDVAIVFYKNEKFKFVWYD